MSKLAQPEENKPEALNYLFESPKSVSKLFCEDKI